MINSIKDLVKIKKSGLDSLYPKHIRIAVGMATCGIAAGAVKIYEKLTELASKSKKKIEIAKTGCIGLCQAEPLIDVFIPEKGRVIYSELTPKKLEVLFKDLENGEFPKGNSLFIWKMMN